MRASRIRTVQMLGCFACGALALRPVPAVERVLDSSLVSTRLLSSLARPLAAIGVVSAAESDPATWEGILAAEQAEQQALEEAVLRSAEPTYDLGESVVPVHAEVVGRPKGALDVVEVRVNRVGLVQIGQPVVAGDVYVGVVSSVRLGMRSGARVEHVEVQLITGREARIGAQVIDPESGEPLARAVVGGLLEPADFGLAPGAQVLCVHYPTQRSLEGGRLVVADPEGQGAGATDHCYLANGFSLGRLAIASNPDERTRERLLGVQAELDYRSGLYQVLILTRPRTGDAPKSEQRPRWASASLALRADPSVGRSGRKLLRGSMGDVRVGAAVASGVRLYGRVSRVGPWSADVRTLEDPGLRIPVIAALSDPDGPGLVVHVLGGLISRGRDADGRLRMLWSARVPIEGDQSRPARLWTGSGEAGVDRGLLLGDTWLPVGEGPHELLVEPPPGPREPGDLRVRLRDLADRAKERE